MIKINDYEEFIGLLGSVIHKYNQLENKHRTFGTKTILSKSEIHTIVAVGDNPGINITSLAGVLGVTKGAASQMIYKLVAKGTVEKKVSPDSDTEVVLTLTKEGQMNYHAHNKFHSQVFEESSIAFRNMSESSYNEMIEVLSTFEQIIEKRLNES